MRQNVRNLCKEIQMDGQVDKRHLWESCPAFKKIYEQKSYLVNANNVSLVWILSLLKDLIKEELIYYFYGFLDRSAAACLDSGTDCNLEIIQHFQIHKLICFSQMFSTQYSYFKWKILSISFSLNVLSDQSSSVFLLLLEENGSPLDRFGAEDFADARICQRWVTWAGGVMGKKAQSFIFHPFDPVKCLF